MAGRWGSRAARVIVALAVGVGASVLTTEASSGSIISTSTRIVSSANPAQAGEPVTLTAIVTYKVSLNPVAPAGEKLLWTVGASTHESPLSCNGFGLNRTCTTSIVVSAPAGGSPLTVRADYLGNRLWAPSSATHTQHGTDPQECSSSEACSVTVIAANGSAELTVAVDPQTDPYCYYYAGYHSDYPYGCGEPYQILASFSAERLSCATSPADTGVGDVTAGYPKTFTYTVFGEPAVNRTSTTGRCWAADQPFPGSTPNGDFFEGLLLDCEVAEGPPCVVSQEFIPAGEGPAAWRTVVSAPAGDPKIG